MKMKKENILFIYVIVEEWVVVQTNVLRVGKKN